MSQPVNQISSSTGASSGAVAYDSVDDSTKEKTAQARSGRLDFARWTGSFLCDFGDFAGWNFGQVQGGHGGMLVATLLIALMYSCMVFGGLAELSAMIPTAVAVMASPEGHAAR